MDGGATLAFAFAAVLTGGLLASSGARNRSLGEILKGVTSPNGTAASAGTVSASEPSSQNTSSTSKGSLQSWIAKEAKKLGWSSSAWGSVIERESGWNPKATNPSSGAFGIGQFLGSTETAYASRGATSTNPIRQLEAMRDYISERYGNPTHALAHEKEFGWY